VRLLLDSGYRGSEITAYLLCGLPGQNSADVRESLQATLSLGVRVSLSEYSPVPGTPLWKEAEAACRYPIADEPLFQNNSLHPFVWERFTEEDWNELKTEAAEGNRKLLRQG
jgi:coproporphyrinogen III oxidase-like Fe-S oxidoreductase